MESKNMQLLFGWSESIIKFSSVTVKFEIKGAKDLRGMPVGLFNFCWNFYRFYFQRFCFSLFVSKKKKEKCYNYLMDDRREIDSRRIFYDVRNTPIHDL